MRRVCTGTRVHGTVHYEHTVRLRAGETLPALRVGVLRQPLGRGLHSATFRLQVSPFRGIGGAFQCY